MTPTTPRRSWFAVWRWPRWVLLLLAYLSIENFYRDAYAVSWVAGMVTRHLEANNQHLPRSWDDLRDDYETAANSAGKPWSFSELRWRVNVDWYAQTAELNNSVQIGKNFQVVWLRDGLIAHWRGEEPNQIIREYLRDRMMNRPADALDASAR